MNENNSRRIENPRLVPPIAEGSYVVIRADGFTGLVLSKNGAYAQEGEDIYYVFKSLDKARKFSEEELMRNQLIEYVIQDHKGEDVERYSNREALLNHAAKAGGKKSSTKSCLKTLVELLRSRR
jgi:hypothetical protein